MIDRRKFKMKLVENGLSQLELCNTYNKRFKGNNNKGLTEQTLSSYLTHKTAPDIDVANNISSILKLTTNEKAEIFLP